MKFKVFKETPEPEELVITLQLIENGNGSVDVIVRRDDGGHCYLLQFETKGTILRQASVDKNLGFQLDKYGCIVIGD